MLGAVLFTAAVLGASLLDMHFGVQIAAVSVKLIISAVLILIYTKNGLHLSEACGRRYFLFALIPFIFAFAMSFGIPDASPGISAVISGFLGVFSTVLAEELYYRAAVLRLFRGEKITYRLVLLLSLVFSLSHAVNYFFADALAVTLQLAVAFSLGTFTLGIFLRTRNIIIPMLSHLLLNGTPMFFELFSGNGGAVGYAGYLTICIIMIIVLTSAGFVLTKSVLNKTI